MAESISVVYLDRASRTPTDIEEVITLLRDGVLLHQVGLGRSIGGDELTLEDEYMLRLDAARAALEVGILSRRVKEGVKRREAAGLPSGPVPPGLKPGKLDGRRIVILDEDQAPRVRQLLEEYADGRHSLDTLTERALELGILTRLRRPPSRSSLANLLGNPLLMGKMKDLRPGSFPAVISEELWYRVQAVREIQRTRPVGAGKQAFALGQLLKCGVSGHAVVGLNARGRTSHYTYYRCSGRTCPERSYHTREVDLLDQAQALLSTMEISAKLADALHSLALDELRSAAEVRASERESLDRQHRTLEEKILRATEARLAGETDPDATTTLIHRWRTEQAVLRNRQGELGEDADDLGEDLALRLELARGVAGALHGTAERNPRAARAALAYYLEDGSTLTNGELSVALRPAFSIWAGTASDQRFKLGPVMVDTGLEPVTSTV